MKELALPLRPVATNGRIKAQKTVAPILGGVWYKEKALFEWGDILSCLIPKSKPDKVRFVRFDMLLVGNRFVTFFLQLRAHGRNVTSHFCPLCECQTRIVVPVRGVLRAQDEIVIGIARRTKAPLRFCITPVVLTSEDPRPLNNPILPRGPLSDSMGQSILHDWPNKTPNVDTMVRRLRAKRRSALKQRWPAMFSRWGGWKKKRVKATGFFRTHHDGHRWWLVDPAGYLFWSSGMDCVHASIGHESKLETRYMNLQKAHAELPNPLGSLGRCYRVNPWHSKDNKEFNYLEANFIRAFGPEHWYDHWITTAHAELRRLGFNTAGDWSDEYAARREGTPYTRPLELHFKFAHTPMAVGAIPDVFHPNLAKDAAVFAESLRETVNDPALLGYFLHNEPHWHSWSGGPAGGMLFETHSCHTRLVLADFLRRRYRSDKALARAWDMSVTLKAVSRGAWSKDLTPAACRDLEDFSTVMIDKLCRTMSTACRKVDPNHLNLGVRWWTFPPLWALKGMGCFDVISFNYYLPRVDTIPYQQERENGVERVMHKLNRPFLVGEWHFGALDAGLPTAGLYRTSNQQERAKAFRVYVENAAALPWCVGAHWFLMYDGTVLTSSKSNENANIGFFDITHNPHVPICRAARATHERLYKVASCRIRPFNRPVEYLFPSR